MKRCIFHVDVNSAFLSWSALKRLEEDPEAVDLRTIPSAVGGDVKTRHGVITAKSIPAKKMGIKTGEPVVKALQKCPSLVLVQADFQTYRMYSGKFIACLREYTDCVEQVSIDEAYMDLTGRERDFVRLEEETGKKFPYCVAEKLKEEIKEELKFTVNVGISVNKLLAKTASDFEKPDRIHTLFPEEIPKKFWPLPIGQLHGCGQATEARLVQMGLRTIGETAHADPSILCAVLGEKGGRYIYESCNGRSDSPVRGEREEAKGYSNEVTTSSNITSANYTADMPPVLHHLAEKVAGRMQRDGVYASTIGVMVKTDAFRRRSRQMTLQDPTNDARMIEKTADYLMEKLLSGLFDAGAEIRLVGISATNLDRGKYRQVSLEAMLAEAAEQEKEKRERQKKEALRRAQEKQSAQRAEKNRRLGEMMKKIRAQFGEDLVMRGTEFTISREKQREKGREQEG